jgi:hypothetical protein
MGADLRKLLPKSSTHFSLLRHLTTFKLKVNQQVKACRTFAVGTQAGSPRSVDCKLFIKIQGTFQPAQASNRLRAKNSRILILRSEKIYAKRSRRYENNRQFSPTD